MKTYRQILQESDGTPMQNAKWLARNIEDEYGPFDGPENDGSYGFEDFKGDAEEITPPEQFAKLGTKQLKAAYLIYIRRDPMEYKDI